MSLDASPLLSGGCRALDVSPLLSQGQSAFGRVTPSLSRLEQLWTCHLCSLKPGATLDVSLLLSGGCRAFGCITPALLRPQCLWMCHPCSLEARVPLDVPPLLSGGWNAFGNVTPAPWRSCELRSPGRGHCHPEAARVTSRSRSAGRWSSLSSLLQAGAQQGESLCAKQRCRGCAFLWLAHSSEQDLQPVWPSLHTPLPAPCFHVTLWLLCRPGSDRAFPFFISPSCLARVQNLDRAV